MEMVCWNVRGLNSPAKKDALRELADSMKVAIWCILETKLVHVDTYIIMRCLGPAYDGFAYLPSSDTRGGIFIAWDSSQVLISNTVLDSNFITGYVSPREGQPWWLSVVYGPQEDAQKITMMEELTARRGLCPGPWMAVGDFNMILNALDKNNSLLDRRMMGHFKRFVDDNALKELFLHGRRFTWSNERENPTMTKIDRALVSVDWELAYPECLLQALSTNTSDHCPLFLSMEDQLQPRKRFRFELFWVKLDGFLDAVPEGWTCEESITDPFVRLDVLLRNCAKHLTAWGQRKVRNIKIQIATANMDALSIFGEASALRVNFTKSAAVLIRSDEEDEELVRQVLPWQMEKFPVKYLGLKLGIKQLMRSNWQPIVDSVLKLMPGWQRGVVTRPGHLILVNQVVRTRPTHHLIVAEAPKWALEKIDKGCRAFFWAGTEEIQGGKCAVAWKRVCRPKELGSLGVMDLYKQGLALRLRWEWLNWTDNDRPWQGLNLDSGKDVIKAFDSLVKWNVGKGSQVLFWRDRWINGSNISEIAPLLIRKVRKQVVNRRKVNEALLFHAWTQDYGCNQHGGAAPVHKNVGDNAPNGAKAKHGGCSDLVVGG
ncbi:uncharacterized protein [Aegilops tauschii subsp. strangulata]|uniref:uncharacterized protein n=1 Tax=Aegilops tauschii subsp. strangulata TaxID=200361 RepID=UPI003CC849C7